MTQLVQLWHLEEAVSDKLTSGNAEAGITDSVCVYVCVCMAMSRKSSRMQQL